MKGGQNMGKIVCFQNFGAGDIMELSNGDMISFRGAVVDFEKQIVNVD